MFFKAVLTSFFFISYGMCENIAIAQTDISTVDLKITGSPETVFDWQKDACEPMDIPDMPAHAFRDNNGRIQLIASHFITRRMIGRDLNHLTHDCKVLMSSNKDPDPSKFDDKEWLNSTYTLDGKTIYALVHNEYHGWEHPGYCSSDKFTYGCWYAAVTSAVSIDSGESYTRLPAPQHLVATMPYRYQPGIGPVGINDTTNIFYNEKDGYYYVLATSRKQYQVHPRGVCLMRTKDLADPASWRAWDGKNFSVQFIDPYLHPDARPEEHIFRSVQQDDLGIPGPSNLTFNTYLNRFMLLGIGWTKDVSINKYVWGICYSFSNDLVHWTPRKLLWKSQNLIKLQPGNPEVDAYPSAIDPDSPSRNFDTTGKTFSLYYTRFNYTRPNYKANWGLDRDLVRVAIEVTD